MTDPTLRIKNLAIALEAISRINTSRSHEHSVDIEGLLSQEIYAYRKAQQEDFQWPPKARPAKSPFNDADDDNYTSPTTESKSKHG